MAIKLEMDGTVFTFDTTEEYAAFTKLHNEVAEVEAAKEEPIKVGDMVEIIGNTDFYHDHEIGNVGEVIYLDDEDYLVNVDGHEQYVPKQDVKKVGATAKKEAQKETFYMIKSEYVDTDTEGQREFKKGADEVLIGNKREADGLVALVTDYEFIGDVIERFDGEDREGKVAFDVEHVYEVTREEFEAKKQAYLAEKEAIKVGDLITGTDDNPYGLTNEYALMEVVDSMDNDCDDLRVRRLKHADGRTLDDSTVYGVESKHFVKTTEEEFDAKHGIETKKEAKKEVPEGFVKVSFAAAKEGDYFLALVDGFDIEAGEMYVLSERCEGGLEFIDDEADERKLSWRDEDEDGIVIRKIVEEDAQEESFKVGDKVRVKASYYHNFPEGTIGTIEKQSFGSTKWVVKTDEKSLQGIECSLSGAGTQSIDEAHLEHVSLDEVTDKPSFKEGDKVRVKAADYHHIEDGYVGTITSISSGNTHKSHGEVIATPYFVGWQFIAAKDLTLVDEGLTIDGDVDVSSVYKIEEGDVVRTTRKYTDFLDDSIKEGRLAVVLETRDSGAITVKQRSGKDYIVINAEDVEDTLELVAKAIK